MPGMWKKTSLEAGRERWVRCALPYCRASVALVLGVVLLLAAGCGYHMGGKGTALPTSVKTIAVPTFRNDTTRYKAEQVLTQAVVRELLARTRYRIQPEAGGADAVLAGAVTQFWSTPIVVEPTAGRTISVGVSVHVRVRLTDSHSGKLLYENPDFIFNETYEISGDARTYFEEGGPAMERLARSFAGSLVSSILNYF